MVLKYCKPNNNKELLFSSFKISSLFSMKDRVPLTMFINLFVGAVKLITSVTRSDIYQLVLKNIWKQKNVPWIQTSKWITKIQGFKQSRLFFCYRLCDNTLLFKHQKRYVHWLAKTALNKHVDFLARSICV